MMTQAVCILGSGSWATAAAGLLAGQVQDIRLLVRSAEVADAINSTHKNPRHLTDYVLPAEVSATHDVDEAFAGAEALVVAIPSAYIRSSLEQLKGVISAELPILVLTKGVEAHTQKLMSDIVLEVLGNSHPVAALSGPNHAEEICKGVFSAAVIASDSEDAALFFQQLFMSERFRVYTSLDIVGVELCAAIKNVIAIACGMCAGSGYGDNTLAVLMTRGLAEMSRFVHASGGQAMTCMGLAGMGDLVATCTSQHSRNRSFGVAFAQGKTLEAYQAETNMVVEGAAAVRGCYELAQKLGIEAPLTAVIFAMLYENMDLAQAASCLIQRSAGSELYGLL